MIREIYIKEKKTKDPVIILFTLNYNNSEIDHNNFE